MAGYITIFRDYYTSDLYRKSSHEQREVIQAVILRVNYESKIINFGGVSRILALGDVWLSRKGLVKELNYASVQDSHVRYALDKLVKNGFLQSVTSSRSGGSIYKCTSKFYTEIAEPFDVRKLEKTTNEQPTSNLRTTNEQLTNNQPKQLSINDLQGVATYEQPTSNLNLTNEQRGNNLNELITNNKEHKNNEMISEKSDFEIQNKKDFIKNPSSEIERKKVAAKKESEFPPAADELSQSSLSLYTQNDDSIIFWQKKFPTLEIREEFEKIRANRGDDPVANLYSFVSKCLENALVYNQTSQKKSSNGNYRKENNWAAQNGKRIAADKFAKYGSGGLIAL